MITPDHLIDSRVNPEVVDSMAKVHWKKERTKMVLRQLIVIALVILTILGAFVLPSFETVLSLIGNALGMILLILVPIFAYTAVFGWQWNHAVIVVITVFMAVVGTSCSFIS